MLKRRDTLERLIYLDADFISSAYEEIKDVSPETSFDSRISQRPAWDQRGDSKCQ